MVDYFLADAALLSNWAKLNFNPVSAYFLSPQFLVFFYILFISVTPAMYISVGAVGGAYREHLVYMLGIYLISVAFLTASSLFFFIFFYELAIIPIFFILRKFGHYYRRVQASFLILIWALLGSFFLFVGLLLVTAMGATSFEDSISAESNALLLAATLLILGFLVKVPMWPFHFWISRAHAEGPTNLSIFLSGVLVKLSVFGILRFLDFFSLKYSFFVLYGAALIGVVDSTMKMLIQVDAKVVIAFSTTVQMNFALFVVFTMSSLSGEVLNLALTNHMLTASILFFIADIVLVRFNSREFFFISGLHAALPIFSAALLFSLINQINFPGFLGFVLDVAFAVYVLPGYPLTSFILFFFLFSIEHLYIFYFFLKICFGVSMRYSQVAFRDLSLAESLLFVYLLSVSIFWGLFPAVLVSAH